MGRIICLAAVDLCGLVQTGYIYSKLHGTDIRQHGSGHSGATNVLRVMGKKAGLIVFLGDAFKALIPCVLVRLILAGKPDYAQVAYLYALYLGFGVTLGHNFPFYMGFKGGKGVAVMAGLLASMDWRLTLICLVLFVGAVLITHYVSVGSILVALAFFGVNVYLSWKGEYGLSGPAMTEFWILSAVVAGMAIWRHRANIKRLIHGNENMIWGKKK